MEKHKNHSFKLNSCALGVSVGVTWGLCLFLFALLNIQNDWGSQLLALLGSVYIGFTNTVAGAFIGLLWGLFEGFVGGFIVAFLYNFVVTHCGCKSCCKTSCR